MDKPSNQLTLDCTLCDCTLPTNSDIVFSIGDREILRLSSTGEAYYRKQPIKRDFQRIYYGFKDFLAAVDSEKVIVVRKELEAAWKELEAARVEIGLLRAENTRLAGEISGN